MRRILSLFSLLIASLWLVAGTSAHGSDNAPVFGEERGCGELRSSLKTVKIHVSPFKLARAIGVLLAGTPPQRTPPVFAAPGHIAVRDCGPRFVRRPESLPAPPSLTGRIVILV